MTQGPVCNVRGQVNDGPLNVLQWMCACDSDMAPWVISVVIPGHDSVVNTESRIMQIYGNEMGHYYECLLFISVKNSLLIITFI